MTSPTRTETDSFGPIEVPADCYWGAQTQRSIDNFPFGPREANAGRDRSRARLREAGRRRV
jgi:fumarate hydratase class II